jgi:hypothetical protein
MRRLAIPLLPSLPGFLAISAGLVLLALPSLAMAALGAELLALAFWLWARASADRRDQLPRWAWLRRPAMALWLAAAIAMALPPPRGATPSASATSTPAMPRSRRPVVTAFERFALTPPGTPAPAGEAAQFAPPNPLARDPLAPLRALGALAVLWAGLELLAALPLSRPYPDLNGPLPNAGPWLPAVLPAAGFVLLWRHAGAWSGAAWLREVAELVLALAAGLAALRAYTRRSWTASLRWLAVFDSALAGLLVALDTLPTEAVFLLWFAAAGGRLMALAAEVRGATARRGPRLAALWRAASWTAGASLAWPLVLAAGFAGGHFRPFEFIVLGAPVFLAARLTVRRLVAAPERRAFARHDPARALSVAGAIATLALGPTALALAWWTGFEASFPGVLLAALPSVLGWIPSPRPPDPGRFPVLRVPVLAGASARDFALAVYRSVTGVERRLAGALGAMLRAIGAPARDLHTGDAQEYLLFLVGVAVLALLMPLLR